MELNTRNSLVCLSFMILVISATAQTARQRDPANYIVKYDTAFNGIGPKIYFLPSPRTEKEAIIDEFGDISTFNTSIQQALLYQALLKSYLYADNNDEIETLIKANSIKLEDWDNEIKLQQVISDDNITIGLLNNFAKKYIVQKETSKAEALLIKALSIATEKHEAIGIKVLQSNLSWLYFYNKNFIDAGKIQEAYYKEAIREKSLINQANSLVRIATIQAFDKDYKSAENTIIRKAIPLFNKSKDYDGKINAWVELAKIYQLYNKHPEAQWFLIQARDLSKMRKINTYNTDIEYMLGYSKFIQNNLNVSKVELTEALNLAQKNGNKYIELSTIQMLGQISTQQDRINDAQEFLNSYWRLRKELF